MSNRRQQTLKYFLEGSSLQYTLRCGDMAKLANGVSYWTQSIQMCKIWNCVKFETVSDDCCPNEILPYGSMGISGTAFSLPSTDKKGIPFFLGKLTF